MPIVDDRGRLLGEVNLVDLSIGVLLVVLLPAAYGSYLLFREPTPTLSAVAPQMLLQGPHLQVEVRGQHLRPYMRVSFGDQQGADFWFVNASTAVVPLPDLAPGTYDVALYDYRQEVARLPGALTIEPPPAPPTAQVDVSGVLSALTLEQAQKIGPGQKFFDGGAEVAEVLSVGLPAPEVLQIQTGGQSTLAVPVPNRVQLPIRIRTICTVRTNADGALQCTVGGVALARQANVRYPGLNTSLILHVTEVAPADASRK